MKKRHLCHSSRVRWLFDLEPVHTLNWTFPPWNQEPFSGTRHVPLQEPGCKFSLRQFFQPPKSPCSSYLLTSCWKVKAWAASGQLKIEMAFVLRYGHRTERTQPVMRCILIGSYWQNNYELWWMTVKHYNIKLKKYFKCFCLCVADWDPLCHQLDL